MLTATALVLAAAAPAQAQSPPLILSSEFAGPPTRGADSRLVVTARARGSSIGPLSVGFGRDEGAFGTSACRPPDSRGRVGPPFTPGSLVRFSVPHRFLGGEPRPVLIRLDAWGCGAGGGTTLQTLSVTPTAAGEPSVPVIPGPPVELPDSGGLPGLPLRRTAATAGASCAHTRLSPTTPRRLRLARQAVQCLINRERRRRGLRPLGRNAALRRAALRHSKAMVRRRFFAHQGPNGPSLVQRLRHYLRGGGRWGVGENLAYGLRRGATAAAVVSTWMRSTGHRANLLAPGFRDMGIGVAGRTPVRRRSGATYTADFGFRR